MLMCALAPNFGTLVVGRVLGGFSLAGGSVTLGMVADLYEPEVQGYAVAWVVLSSVGGTTIGVSGPFSDAPEICSHAEHCFSQSLVDSKANSWDGDGTFGCSLSFWASLKSCTGSLQRQKLRCSQLASLRGRETMVKVLTMHQRS